ncbi:MAG: family 10 glycosylhydrolase [Muribaculaceae bacterium]|nr:family 10 glycosylhydrolase [Muribaculaceae bacterium]
MKKQLLNFLAVALLITAFAMPTSAAPKREHRSVWCSAFVSDWPSTAITDANAEAYKGIGRKMLDSLQVNNFTTIYYHVRAMCDAMYDSKYEPWSSYLTGTRGKVPAFDPFQFLIEEGHKRGIEVYAWANPYRYASAANNDWGQSDRDYIHTHPEWLLRNTRETILNPGLPEVEQRIVDVCEDIITKYDVDGLIFDDYFYNSGGIDMSADADLYQAYVNGGGTMAQGDWRRENVNTMVRKVNAMIKSVKPWVRFGISPAGIAGTANTSASKYGVRPSPGSDWQYNQIHSDPLAWMSEGTIDFVSPQVYWPVNGANDFDAVSEWWSYIAKTFNRHCYVSQTLSSFSSNDINEYVDEINISRNYSQDAAPGTVYFKWTTLRNGSKVVDGKVLKLMNYLKSNSFQSKALTPATPWYGANRTACPTTVASSANKLTWNGADNSRFVIYAIPEAETAAFNRQQEYIIGISYTKDFEIPEDAQSGKKYAVSTLDRYGNESSATFEGATVTAAPAISLVSPANNVAGSGMINFKWASEATIYDFEVATDADMNNTVFHIETEDKYLLSTAIPGLKSGITYYWRVTSKANNANNSVSEIRSFTIDEMKIKAPLDDATNVSINASIAWSPVDDATYVVAISDSETMENPVFTSNATTTEFNLPLYTLCYGKKYFVQITAKAGEYNCASNVVSFTTENGVPTAPIFENPSADGATLFSDSHIIVAPQEGIYRVRLEISASSTFPTRSTYIKNLDNFICVGDAMADVKLSGSALVDGKTYYLRARTEYYSSETTSVLKTDYSPAYSFVYSSGSGVESVTSDNDVYIDGIVNPKLVITDLRTTLGVSIYNIAGVLISGHLGENAQLGYNSISLNDLAAGSYLVKVNCNNTTKAIKFTR